MVEHNIAETLTHKNHFFNLCVCWENLYLGTKNRTNSYLYSSVHGHCCISVDVCVQWVFDIVFKNKEIKKIEETIQKNAFT